MLFRVLYALGQWAHRVPHPRHILVVSDGKSGPYQTPSPGTCVSGSSSHELQRLFRVLPSPVCSMPPGAEHLPWGCLSLFVTSTRSVHAASVPNPPPFRPRRFSRPRRFPPLLALWVCFTPQPRPGFSLQGLVLSHSRCTSSVRPCPHVVSAQLLLAVSHQRHNRAPRPQGFHPCESSRSNMVAVSRRARSLPS